jgi:hypothetical protein
VPGQSKQPAVPRVREGGLTRKGESEITDTKSLETRAERSKGGRPKGSKTKPKGLIPLELADKFLDSVRPLLPVEHYEEMKAAVKGGKNISTVTEAKIMLKLMGPSLMRRLIDEYDPDKGIDPEILAETGPREIEFKKDTNERLKVWMDLLGIVNKMENIEDAAAGHNKAKPLTEITIKRGLDAGRLAILVGSEPSSMGGDGDGIGRETVTVRAIPDSVFERPFDVQDSEQESSVGVLDGVEYRDGSRSDSEEEL